MRQRRVRNEEEKIAQYSAWIAEEPKALKGHWAEAFATFDGEAAADDSAAETVKPEIYMEIGCGKGKFITGMARMFPERNFIAVEGAGTVVLRALEKTAGVKATVLDDEEDGSTGAASEAVCGCEDADGADDDLMVGEPLHNIRFITDYVQTLDDLFEPGEVKGIYLNFSDPWPKERHAKRRLTHRKYLTEYKKILTPGSVLEFKSDNDDLFRFSVQEFYDFGLEILELTDDLHGVLMGPTHRTVVLDSEENEVPLPGPGESAAASAEVTTEYEDRFTEAGKNVHYCKVRF